MEENNNDCVARDLNSVVEHTLDEYHRRHYYKTSKQINNQTMFKIWFVKSLRYEAIESILIISR